MRWAAIRRVIVFAMVFWAISATALAGVLVNGDFDASPFDLGWNNAAGDSGPARLHSGLTAGSNQAAAVLAPGSDLSRTFEATGPDWTVEFYIAAPDPALHPGADRSFNVLLTNKAGGWLLNIRVAPDGGIQCYDGSSWRNAGRAGEISFSTDADGDGDFADPADTLNVHRIQIVGRSWASTTACYDIMVSPANSDDLSPAATDLTFYQSKPDSPEDQLESIIFRSKYGMVAGQFFVVDDCRIKSNDAIVIEQTGGTTMVSEQGATSDTFSVVLKQPLTSSVTISLSRPAGPEQLTVSPQILAFSARDNKRTATVTVTAVDDSLQESDPHYVPIAFQVSSSDPNYKDYALGSLSVAIFDNDFGGPYSSFSGIYPHMAVTNSTRSESGIGAVAAWADSLWFITYSAHKPLGSDDGLYQVHPDLHMTRRPESVGGTPANRLIHRESNQLAIGSYLIDAQGNVRTIPLSKMPGRMTATARHLTDPANKLYFITMEEGLYELDVHNLAVTTLHVDRNIGGGNLLPGNHGKGGYTGQGRLILSNNGDGGALAEWDGTGDPGNPSSWTTVDRNKYTDITGPGGVHGAPDADAPVWAIGWDHKSVLLNVCDEGGVWKRFRLPKASYTQDADHGWFTEWPRIRHAQPNRLLMDMHFMFYDFPGTFGHSNTAGIRPLATHLKMVVDWDQFQGQMVRGCDDASHFGNSILGRAQSNLWFGSMDELADLGRAEGWGGPWVDQAAQADEPSEPYLIAGFDHVVVHFAIEDPLAVDMDVEIDTEGADEWTRQTTVQVPANGYAYYILPPDTKGQWIRFRTGRSVVSATAYLHSSCDRQVLSPEMFQSVPQAGKGTDCSIGLIRPDEDESMPLHFAADMLDASGAVAEQRFYIVGRDMQIQAVDDPDADSWLRTNAATTKDFEVDGASVIMTDDKGQRFRLPKGDPSFDSPTASGWPRGVREVVTERDLMNVHGTIYELPRSASGGLRKIRPITTHNRMIYDFCSWRGMLVIAGNLSDASQDGHFVRSEDGKAGLWFGCVDDLFRLGTPRGVGGPWKDTAVEADRASYPYLMTGYAGKTVELYHDLPETVTFTIEVDFLGDGTWCKYGDFPVAPRQKLKYKFPEGYSAHWVRLKANKSCTATAWFLYNRFCDGTHGLKDLSCMSGQWLRKDCGFCNGADLTLDAVVDLRDLAVLAAQWLSQV